MRCYSAREMLEIINQQSPLGQKNMQQLRRDFEEFYLQFSSENELSVERQQIGHIPGFWIAASKAKRDRAVLFFHGGGFTIGSTRDHLDLCGKLSISSGASIFSVDYRLAPEHPFPAALEDCLDSYHWLLKRGIAPSKIVLAGISAGGNLALSTLLSIRDKGFNLPAAAVCMSPAVDMLFQGDSAKANFGKDWITPERLSAVRDAYLHGQDPKDPLASPLYADLHGLAPLMIQAGGGELLLDDIRKFHRKAVKSGVPVTFELWEDMFHCWQIFSTHLSEGQKAIESAGAYIRKMLSTKK